MRPSGQAQQAAVCVIAFFFAVQPRPPSATLFPYTTLFRSQRVHTHEVDVVAQHHQVAGLERGIQATTDRKSTRLNSSHVAISYAVFCLKKKTDIAPPSREAACISCARPA